MKRYLLFSGWDYYPRGGWNDFKGSFDTVDKAKQALNALYDKDMEKYTWSHIIDSETEKAI
jgi:hypothetical protein